MNTQQLLCRREPVPGGWATCKWWAAANKANTLEHALGEISTVCLFTVPACYTLCYSWAKPLRIHNGGYSHGCCSSWAFTHSLMPSISEKCKGGVVHPRSQDARSSCQHATCQLQANPGLHGAILNLQCIWIAKEHHVTSTLTASQHNSDFHCIWIAYKRDVTCTCTTCTVRLLSINKTYKKSYMLELVIVTGHAISLQSPDESDIEKETLASLHKVWFIQTQSLEILDTHCDQPPLIPKVSKPSKILTVFKRFCFFPLFS